MKRVMQVPCAENMYGHTLTFKSVSAPPVQSDAKCDRCGLEFNVVLAEPAEER